MLCFCPQALCKQNVEANCSAPVMPKIPDWTGRGPRCSHGPPSATTALGAAVAPLCNHSPSCSHSPPCTRGQVSTVAARRWLSRTSWGEATTCVQTGVSLVSLTSARLLNALCLLPRILRRRARGSLAPVSAWVCINVRGACAGQNTGDMLRGDQAMLQACAARGRGWEGWGPTQHRPADDSWCCQRHHGLGVYLCVLLCEVRVAASKSEGGGGGSGAPLSLSVADC
eukprot:COSAG01_NODE_684_length_14252_cov_4.041617_3_plen_227_part_00